MQPSVSQPLASKLHAVFLQHHSILTQRCLHCKGFERFFLLFLMKMFSIHFVVYFIEGSLTFLGFCLVLVQKKTTFQGGFREIIMKKKSFRISKQS